MFFGGGTPSLVDPERLVALLDAIPRGRDAEVTIECNPETVTPRALEAYARAGVNRLSFGVQSMMPRVLATLGREHAPDSVRHAVEVARAAGFENWNADLIYGAAGETVEDWRCTLEQVLALAPAHVSAYALTVEAGTPLERDPARHPDDDDQAEKYVIADRVLAQAGFEWYEISNWARPGRECRHNQLYWAGHPYRGIGCAAHSFDGTRRWWNIRTPERYIDAIERGRSPEAAADILDTSSRRVELLALQLRTRDGVPAAALPEPARADVDELVEPRGDRVVLTTRGRLLANEVALRLR